MNARMRFFFAGLLFLGFNTARAQQEGQQQPRHITLQEAVQLAMKHNHVVRISELRVEESQHAKDVARSGYFPSITNESQVLHVTDTQFLSIVAGSLGVINGTPIPAQSVILAQGGRTFITSGTGLVEPLTPLFTKVKPSNDAARAALDANRANAKETANEIALKVHQLYYGVLITQLHRSASQARIRAAEQLKSERTQEVKYGSALDEDLIESTAQTLEAKQELLTTELQLSDLTMQLDNLIGLPVSTELELDPSVPGVETGCKLEDCVKLALESHPEIVAAGAEVSEATAGVRLSKADYVPDIDAFARYSYQDQVPFLARNFGSFGVKFTYDIFDGGRRHASVLENDARLAQAKENLARVTEDVELQVQIAYRKLERTREMVNVSQELLALRSESSRVFAEQLQKGAALQSQVEHAVAQEFDAKTALLQAQLDYIQARDAITKAMGLTP
jgi:outer membrane protein TolC